MAQSDTTSIATSELREALDRRVFEILLPVTFWLGVFYLAECLARVTFQPWTEAAPRALSALASSATFLSVRAALPHVALSHVHLASGIAVLLLLVNMFLLMVYEAGPWETPSLVICLLGVGAVFLSPLWFAATAAAIDAGWLATWGSFGFPPEWHQLGGVLLAGNLLAVVIFLGRRRMLVRIEESAFAAHASEERFRRLAEATSEGVALHERGCIVDANDGLGKLFGAGASTFVGRPIASLLQPSSHETLERALANGGGFEAVAERSDGTSFPVEVRARSTGGERTGIVTLRDLTDRKRIEEERLRAEGAEALNRKLAEEIERRAAAEVELRSIATELSRSNRELESFAYVASHDLREPLRMISGFTKLLARRYGAQGKEAEEFIHFIVDGVERMDALIQDLLEYSRVGRKEQAARPVSLESVLELVEVRLAAEIEASQATITYGELPTLEADPNHLRQLLQHLVGNALKFRGDDAPRIHVEAVRQGDEWRLSIRDNGIGIDPAQSERVFAIFHRLHGPGRYPGTGIGLAICRKIVERYGGRIWVESSGAGAGSVFTVTWPAQPATARESASKERATPGDARPVSRQAG